MLRIDRLKIHNYVLIEDADLEIGEGVFFVTGENRDEVTAQSNGAGKSMLNETILWVLFDELLRKGLRKDDVIGPSDAYVSVEIEFTKDGQRYKIHRFRGHPEMKNGVELFQNGQPLSKHSDARTNEKIEEILGVDSKVAYYSAYITAGNNILELTPSQTLKVFSDVLDISKWDKLLDVAKDAKDQAEYSLDIFKNDRERLKTLIAKILVKAERVENIIEEFDEARARKIQSCEDEISDHLEIIKEYEPLLSKKTKIQEEYDDYSERIERINRHLDEVAALESKIRNSRSRLAQQQQKLTKAIGKRDEAAAARDNILNNPTGKCSYCGNVLNDSATLQQHLSEIEDVYNRWEVEQIEYSTNVENLKRYIEEQEEELENIKSDSGGREEIFSTFNKVKKKLKSIQEIEIAVSESRRSIQMLNDRIAELKDASEKQGYIDELASLKDDIQDAQSKLEKNTDDIEEVKDKIDFCKFLRKKVREYKAGIMNNFMSSLNSVLKENFLKMTHGDYDCQVIAEKNGVDFRFTNTSKKGEYVPFSLFSTGEQVRILKCFYGALNKVFGCGFLIDDEGLNGMDSAVDVVMDFMLEHMDVETMLFVGHQNSLHDYLRGANQIKVVKEDGKVNVEVIR